MKASYNIKEVDRIFKNPNKTQQDVEVIQQYLYGLPYFQNLFDEIHTSLIPKLIRKFHYGQCQSGGAIIENGNKIKDFFIILEGTCLEMSKNKQQEQDHPQLIEDLDKTPFLKILKQSEERKKSLLFQHSTTQQHSIRNQSSKFKEENLLFKIDSVDETEQTAATQSPAIQQKSLFHSNLNNSRPELEEYFVQQYKKKYEKKGYSIQNTLKEGDYFGGITKKGAEQTFSDIVCCSKVEYVCLAYEDYWNILSQYQLRMCEQKISFLRSYRFLSIYTDHYLNKRLNMFEEISFHRNQSLFEEREDPNYIYFIIEGELVMHKNIDFKRYLDNILDDNKDSPVNNDENNNRKSKSLQRQSINLEQRTAECEDNNFQNNYNSQFRKNIIISYLNQGSYIGLSEILTDSIYTYTVSCYSTNAKAYRLYRSNFEKYFQCEANIEIMAQECLGKEKIYDDILQNHVTMMKEEYLKYGQWNNDKSVQQIFETNKKRNCNNLDINIPSQQNTSNSRQNRKPTVMEQRIKDKLKSQSVKFSKQDIQREKAQHLQDTILNSIHNDPYFRRKLLSNLSSLGFQINQENCNIYNELKLKTSTPISRTSSLANLQQYTAKQKPEITQHQVQVQNQLEKIPEDIPTSKISIANNQNQSSQALNNQLSSRTTLRQNFFSPTGQQELQKQRLSFILGKKENKLTFKKSSTNFQHQRQISNDLQQQQSKPHHQNTPSIEDLKCFENNITYRKENESEPCSPQAQNEYSNFNSRTSIISNNIENEFLTAAVQYETKPLIIQENIEQQQQQQRMSSLSPESTFVAFQDTNLKLQNQQQHQQLSQNNQKYSSQSKKVPFISRKMKMEAALSNENKQKIQLTPKITQEEEFTSPIVSPFQTFRQQLLNNLNKGMISQQPEMESPIKISQQANTTTHHNMISFNNLNLQQLNSQTQRSNSQLSFKFNQINNNETLMSSPTDPSDRRKLQFPNNNNNNNSSLQQQELQTKIVVSQCPLNKNSHRMKSSASVNSSLSKRQNLVKTIQFNLQGGNTNNNNIPSDLRQFKESCLITQNNQQIQGINNIHTMMKSQKSFRDKLYNLVDKHIQENINSKKSYMINNNNNPINSKQNQQSADQVNPVLRSNHTSQSSRLQATNPIQLETFQTTTNRFFPSQENHNHPTINSEQTSPKLLTIKKKKQKSFLAFQSMSSYTQITEQQESTTNNNHINTTVQSPIASKQTSRVLFKRFSIPLLSPTSTKVTQLSTAHSPSFSSFQTVYNKNHSRIPSDQSCSNIIQNLVKNQII